MAKKHPFADLFGEGILTGLFLYGLFRYVIRPISRGIVRLCWRWRRALTPLSAAVVAEILAVLWRAVAPGTWWVALVLPVLGVVLALAGPRLSEPWSRVLLRVVPDSIDAGRKGVLDRPAERSYLAALLTVLGVWAAVRVDWGASQLTEWLWLGGLVTFGGSWWYHRRIRVAGRADRYARRWGKLRDKDRGPIREFHGSRVVRALGTRGQSLLTIRLAEGMTAARIANAMEPLASYFGLRLNSIYMLPVESNARQVQLRILPRDPWKGKILHPAPEPGTVSLRETSGRFDMGVHADATSDIYTLRHTFICGANGSGKSVWMESLLRYLTACDDCVVVAGDLASGATLKMWEPTFARPVAGDYDEVVVLLECVMGVIEDREARLGAQKAASDEAGDYFVPTPDTPWLVVLIDEYPDFVAQAGSKGKEGARHLALAGRIGKRGRKAGVVFILVAQNGSKDDVGSKELQAQLKATVGLYLDQHASRVLWGDLWRSGWNSAGLKTGQYLLKDEDHPVPNVGKGYFLSVRDRRSHVESVRHNRPVLEPTAWSRLMGTGDHLVIDAEPEVAEVDPVLAELEIHPAKAEELIDRTGLSRATVFRRLKSLREAGRVYSTPDHMYHAGAEPRVDAGERAGAGAGA